MERTTGEGEDTSTGEGVTTTTPHLLTPRGQQTYNKYGPRSLDLDLSWWGGAAGVVREGEADSQGEWGSGLAGQLGRELPLSWVHVAPYQYDGLLLQQDYSFKSVLNPSWQNRSTSYCTHLRILHHHFIITIGF